jgi:plastocyanin
MNAPQSTFFAAWSAFALLGSPAMAQGAVSGRISIAEAPGFKTPDLANAVIWLDGPGASQAPPGGAQILMESRQFAPRVRVVTAGSSVSFPNQDPFRHNVFSKSGPGAFDLGLYARGESRATRFDAPGVYPVFCNIHARMVAFVVAVRSALVTQASPDGAFTIPDVPAGEYTLHVWHDRGGDLKRTASVGATGLAALAVQLDARSYKFVQHKNKFGQRYPPDGRDKYE